MSKYKIGDKVYLEGEVIAKNMRNNTYELKYKNWRGDEYTLTDYVTDDVLHPVNKSYNEGLNDAWELAKKIVLSDGDGGYSCDELENIFGYRSPASILKVFTPQKSIAKVKAYEEERNEIKVGDVVKLKGCYIEGIVTRITETNICYLSKDGSCGNSSCNNGDFIDSYFEKTGKHFDSIDEFMRSAD